LKKRADRFCLEARGGCGEAEGVQGHREEVAQTMYTHMNKCINNKKMTSIKNKLTI
jgi:hypothetical protein